jgi:hypothetical protein
MNKCRTIVFSLLITHAPVFASDCFDPQDLLIPEKIEKFHNNPKLINQYDLSNETIAIMGKRFEFLENFKMADFSGGFNSIFENHLKGKDEDTKVLAYVFMAGSSKPRTYLRASAVDALREFGGKYTEQLAQAYVFVIMDHRVDHYSRNAFLKEFMKLGPGYNAQKANAAMSIARDKAAPLTYRAFALIVLVYLGSEYDSQVPMIIYEMIQKNISSDDKLEIIKIYSKIWEKYPRYQNDAVAILMQIANSEPEDQSPENVSKSILNRIKAAEILSTLKDQNQDEAAQILYAMVKRAPLNIQDHTLVTKALHNLGSKYQKLIDAAVNLLIERAKEPQPLISSRIREFHRFSTLDTIKNFGSQWFEKVAQVCRFLAIQDKTFRYNVARSLLSLGEAYKDEAVNMLRDIFNDLPAQTIIGELERHVALRDLKQLGYLVKEEEK